ncbi:DUF4160 domain-containing protein [Aureimonas sp. AU40]|uniref:DUF4160 domain-containing protein n=1 Tax=Aureimonas sp. AU40 TaxID=1637747 RepID=UPI0007817454|nr:DUF4160 domain-containing protein [Aureimonas sp. AU40]
MPTITTIGNIKIVVFADDHNPPHFHILTPNGNALVSIATLSVIRGSIDRKDLRAALDWAGSNQALLQAAWEHYNG